MIEMYNDLFSGGNDGERVLLEHEVFEHIEPGISFYSDNPPEVQFYYFQLFKEYEQIR